MTATPKKPIQHWARVRREVILHRMATSKCLESKLFWAIILWSWCGPEISDAVVLKDAKGYIRKGNDGRPIPAKLKDLRELLGLPEGMKAEVTRLAQRLEEVGAVRFDRKKSSSRDCGVMYPVHEPPTENLSLVAGTRNQQQWCIGRMVVGTRNLPTDPVAKTRAIEWLEETGTAWKSDLKALRTRYRDMLVQAAPALGILYVLEEKKSREVEERVPAPASPAPPSVFIEKNHPSSSSAFSSIPPKRTAEEEESDLYHIFKTEYPAGHFDGANAKPSFEGKSKADQLHAIERLRVYKNSERWKDDDGRWIPLASKWLASAYSEEPPPAVKKKTRTAVAGNGEESYFERRVREEREDSRG